MFNSIKDSFADGCHQSLCVWVKLTSNGELPGSFTSVINVMLMDEVKECDQQLKQLFFS